MKRTKIFYFSGSGNSLDVARDLASELGEAELISIAHVVKEELNLEADRIGVVFPTYIWGVPRIVVNFLKRLKTDKYVFAVATCGGNAGGTLVEAKKILKRAGTKLAAGWSIIMPNSYTPMGEAEPAAKQAEKFKNKDKRIKEITEAVREGRASPVEKGLAIYNFIFTGIIYHMFNPIIARQSRKFHLNEKCQGCGTCVRICPMDNIELKDNKPKWGLNCTLCFGCMQWCPNQAIEFGRGTKGKKRYHNPHITIQDMIYK